MKRAIFLIFAAACIATAPGCSCLGINTQDDMRRYAIKRTNDEEEETGTKAPPTQPVQKDDEETENENETTDSSEVVSVPTTITEEPEDETTDTTEVVQAVDKITPEDDPASPPGELSEVDQRRIAIDRMKRIGEGIERYLKANNGYPAVAIRTKTTPMLSWRVAILPYIGYEELYKRFKLDAPWNHPANEKLLAEIPNIYRDPGRTEANVHFTNFLAVEFGSSLMLREKKRQVVDVTDGIDNTVMVLEVNDSDAVPWTMPQEFEIKSAAGNAARLGKKRSDGTFVLWGGGLVTVIPRSTPDRLVFGAFTAEAGDSLKFADIYYKALADPANTKADTDLVTVVDTPGATDTNTGFPDQTPVDPLNGATTFRMPLYDYAARAMSESRVRDAIRYLNAAMLLDDSDEWLDRIMWCDGLRRPTAEITWGLAATVRTSNDLNQVDPEGDDKRKIIEDFQEATGEIGERFLQHIYEFAERGKLGPLVQGGLLSTNEGDPRRNRGAPEKEENIIDQQRRIEKQISEEDRFSRTSAVFPGAVVFAADNERVLVSLARKREVDVLALFDITRRPLNRNDVIVTIQVKLIDAATGRTLHEAKPINNVEVRTARLDPLKDDPTDALFEQIGGWMRSEFVRTEIPEGLRSEHVRKRLTTLIASNTENPLRTLVELRYYEAEGYLTRKEYEHAVGALLDQDASAYLSGDNEAKAKVIFEWLPKEYQNQAGE